MDEFVVSLLFGGIVILIYSWKQFERPSYERSRELTRVVEFLLPSDLRNRRVYYRAYAFYAGLLLLTYAAICIFATVPILKALGMVVDGVEAVQSPIVPLTVSLAMVGIAPAIPVLQDVEERIRFAAHRLSGIPARLLYGYKRLNARALELPIDGSGCHISDHDWQRMRHYLSQARAIPTDPTDPTDFERDLPKIIAYRAWFIEQKLNIPTHSASPGILRNEEELKARIDRLLRGLDVVTEFRRKNGAGSPDTPRPSLPSAEVWEQFTRDTDELSTDICAMLMLYVEHDLIAPSDAADSETSEARLILNKFLSGTRRWAEDSAVVGVIWTRATIAALIVAALWGLFLGKAEAGKGQSVLPLTATVGYALSTLLIYSLPLFSVLSMHDHYTEKKSWPNMAQVDWTRWMGPAAKVFLVGALVALVCTVSLNIYWLVPDVGLDRILQKFWAIFIAAAAYEGPRAMLGPILAIGVVALIDGWRANATPRWQMLSVASTVLTLVLWAGLARGLSTQYNEALKCGGGEQQDCLNAIPSLVDLLRADDHLMLLTAIRVGVIGIVVMLVCHRTLLRGLGTPDHREPTSGVRIPPAHVP